MICLSLAVPMISPLLCPHDSLDQVTQVKGSCQATRMEHSADEPPRNLAAIEKSLGKWMDKMGEIKYQRIS